MKRILILMAAMLICVPALADYDDAYEIVIIEPVERTVIHDPPTPKLSPVQEYEWDPEVIDAVASIYWAETGANGPRTSVEKLMITQLIWNRSQYGSPFPSDLVAVCKQKGEFNRGRISDRNRVIARENLNKVRSQADGFYQGIDPNMAMAIYMTREGGSGILTFQDDNWVTIYRVEA